MQADPAEPHAELTALSEAADSEARLQPVPRARGNSAAASSKSTPPRMGHANFCTQRTRAAGPPARQAATGGNSFVYAQRRGGCWQVPGRLEVPSKKQSRARRGPQAPGPRFWLYDAAVRHCLCTPRIRRCVSCWAPRAGSRSAVGRRPGKLAERPRPRRSGSSPAEGRHGDADTPRTLAAQATAQYHLDRCAWRECTTHRPKHLPYCRRSF